MHGPAKQHRTWFTSSRSSPAGHCVEMAVQPGAVEVRDSKNRTAGTLRFTSESWREFVAAVRSGQFDRPPA